MRRILILASVVALIAIPGGFLLWAMFSDQSSFSSRLSSFDDLPETAKDISVYKNANMSGLLLIEFTIPEIDLREYALKHSWGLQEIVHSQPIMSAIKRHKSKTDIYRTISDGLYFESRKENGGGVTVAYDREHQIGYVNRSSR